MRIRSQWEDVENALNSWSHAECPTSVGSGDTTLLISTHTPLETNLGPLDKNLSVASTVSSPAFGYSQLRSHAKRRSK